MADATRPQAAPQVGIVLGSDSDLPIIRPAVAVLEELGLAYELVIASAHRTPARVAQYAATAEERGLEVIIAVAGGAAHLPGVLAAGTVLPVIGVPVGGSILGGMDALLSIAQMPGGVPVGCTGINNGKNAALLAAAILAVKYPELREKLKAYRQRQAEEVDAKNERLRQLGVESYLEQHLR